MSFRLAATASLLALSSCVPAERQPGESKPRERPRQLKGPGAELVVTGEEAEAGTSEASTERAPALARLDTTFRDDFERGALGADYLATSTRYRIERGRLCVRGARNHPLWLRRRLPLNARIEVEAESASADGDIKLEAWGDGRRTPAGSSYDDATSYVAIFGGWKNRYHALARLDEHGADRQALVISAGSDDPRQMPVQQNRRYRLKLERTDGKTVRFWVDDVEMLSLTDPLPLAHHGHEHFAFNNWETPVCFDHLVIEPLPG